LGLNNELLAANRTAYLVDESYFEVKDYINNGAEPINLYWNMVTKSLVEAISPSKIKLTQGGKTVILEIVSSNPLVTFTLETNRSTDPVFYNPTATADSKNPGTVMLGFEAFIPANNEVTFTVTIKDDAEVAPSSDEPINHIVLDLPTPTTGREGNFLLSDTSEFHINTDGDASIGGESLTYAWRVNGGTNINNADNTKFFFRWTGMATTNVTEGNDYGALLTPAGMDRASTGELGVRGGAGAGILNGGEINYDLASLFNPTTSGSFRMNKFVFKIIDSGSLSSESFTIDNLNPLIIYPNPFTDSITLQNTTGLTNDCNVKIYALNGTVVFNKTYSCTEANQDIKIDLKALPQGTYLVQLKNGQEITTRKIIKTTN